MTGALLQGLLCFWHVIFGNNTPNPDWWSM